MRAGPTIQLRTSEGTSSRDCRAIAPTSVYRTFASTGYIMSSRPIAIGNEVDPKWPASSRLTILGAQRPSSNPAAMASRIQIGRKRSSNESPAMTFCSSASLGSALIGAVGLASMDVLSCGARTLREVHAPTAA